MQFAGVAGVPEVGVGAVSLNVTVTEPVADGFVWVVPCGGPVSSVSSVNLEAGDSVANAVVVPLGGDGRVCFDTSTPTHVVADLNGWFAAP